MEHRLDLAGSAVYVFAGIVIGKKAMDSLGIWAAGFLASFIALLGKLLGSPLQRLCAQPCRQRAPRAAGIVHHSASYFFESWICAISVYHRLEGSTCRDGSVANLGAQLGSTICPRQVRATSQPCVTSWTALTRPIGAPPPHEPTRFGIVAAEEASVHHAKQANSRPKPCLKLGSARSGRACPRTALALLCISCRGGSLCGSPQTASALVGRSQGAPRLATGGRAKS